MTKINVICAGAGDASLWGGNDTIQSANDGDAVILSTVTLDQIASTNITADSASINFKDGGSLYVEGKSDVYQLADGSSFSANHEQAVWLPK